MDESSVKGKSERRKRGSGLQLDSMPIHPLSPVPLTACVCLNHRAKKAARNHVRTTKWSRPGACDHETVRPADSSSRRWIKHGEEDERAIREEGVLGVAGEQLHQEF